MICLQAYQTTSLGIIHLYVRSEVHVVGKVSHQRILLLTLCARKLHFLQTEVFEEGDGTLMKSIPGSIACLTYLLASHIGFLSISLSHTSIIVNAAFAQTIVGFRLSTFRIFGQQTAFPFAIGDQPDGRSRKEQAHPSAVDMAESCLSKMPH